MHWIFGCGRIVPLISNIMYHVSCITCHLSNVICHMSPVTGHLSPVTKANSHRPSYIHSRLVHQERKNIFETHTKNIQQTNIATYNLNRPGGHFSEKLEHIQQVQQVWIFIFIDLAKPNITVYKLKNKPPFKNNFVLHLIWPVYGTQA